MATAPSGPLPDSSARPSALNWVPVAFFSLLLLVTYGDVLRRLVIHWTRDEDMGHGFFVPAVALYVAWKSRDRLSAISLKPNYWGIVLMVWGAAQMLAGSLGAEVFLARTALLISLIGMLMVLGGFSLVRGLAFPLFLLLFMIPIPRIIYSQITLPLQYFASAVAESILSFIGIPVLRDGNVLQLPHETLSVVEACSGIRSLLSLSFLSLIYAYLFDEKVWMRGVLLAATIPIAIAANALRVTFTGILGEYNPEFAHGFLHTLEGGVLFVVGLLFLVLVHRSINWFIRGYQAARARGPAVAV